MSPRADTTQPFLSSGNERSSYRMPPVRRRSRISVHASSAMAGRWPNAGRATIKQIVIPSAARNRARPKRELVIPNEVRNRTRPGRGAPLPGRVRFLTSFGMTSSLLGRARFLAALGMTICLIVARPALGQRPAIALDAWTLILERRLTGGMRYEDLSFPDERNGWVVSARGDILHTPDGGTTWVTQATDLRGLRSIDFLDAKRGFAGTLTGKLYATTD